MKKRVLSMLFIAMTMIACSSDDSSNIENDVGKEIVLKSEKNNFEVIYTQKGDLDESIMIFSISGVDKGFISSNVVDKSDNKNLGNPALINMHEREEGSHSYSLKDKVESILVNYSALVNDDAKKDLEINVKVFKDGKEVFNQDEKIEIGKTITSKSYTIE
ncbi:hypothetical protein FHR24_000876 [Wenyingzhuangia heitensis]|uniref:Uncharacterized protein n=1 Tax=Wenyingzhuangia heitensis TaxID=1487859 RepID=A0ABX0U6F5_9FLAO|nr:hypothetical protein [Wenyingzhuangia heitensis]NIJ44437.1 hypothetical protein [Wenyingzhuangia heitensis]